MSKEKTILIAGVVGVIVLISVIGLFGCKEKPPSKVELEFWGVFDDSDVYASLISDFNKQYPTIKINYYKKTWQDYEKDLIDAMASGRGPAIFMIHNTWLPRYTNKITTAPIDLINYTNYRDAFVDVAVNDFINQGRIYAVPLAVDTLALYYNKDIFNTAGISQPPRTWNEFMEDVELLTRADVRGNIDFSGAAIGTAENINRSPDIISLLMLQSGIKMTDANNTKATFDQVSGSSGAGERVLQFYTDFSNPTKSVYTWNRKAHYSIDAFYEGKSGMMFNYAYNIPLVRAKAPYLNFGIAKMPQIESAGKRIDFANYWGLTVAGNLDINKSRAGWLFIFWLSQKENAKKYLETTNKPIARRDLIDWQKTDPDLGVFSEQALSAASWYQVDNSAIDTILADMIESVVGGQATIKEALDKAANQVSLLMR